MIVENKTVIDKVEALYPDFMANDSCDKFIEKFNELQELKDKLWESRKITTKLKEQVDALEIELHLLEKFFIIKYGTKQIEEIKNETNMRIINDSDYRNHD